jgi:ATP-dependent Clp protease, protease subunit
MNYGPLTFSQQYPGGVFIGFTSPVHRKAAEQLAFFANDAWRQGYKELHLIMSSPGGDPENGFYAASVLRALPIKVITYNVGEVNSSGLLIFLAGDERYALDGATFHFHRPSFVGPGWQLTETVLRHRMKGFELLSSRLVSYVAERTGKPFEEVDQWCANETLMNAGDAQTHNLVHGVKFPSIPEDGFFVQVVLQDEQKAHVRVTP